MRRLRHLVLALFLSAPMAASAHDPLPLEWRKQITGSTITEIAEFEIDTNTIKSAYARERSSGSTCPPPPASGLRAQAPGLNDPSQYAFWTFEPLENCGGIDGPTEYGAATRLAQAKCLEISLTRNLWPPAIPIVASPGTYVDAKHHDALGYKIEDGPLIGSCVIQSPR
jgi:hypothetical protein